MNWRYMTPENTEIVILCFEGPDPYAMAGGLGARVEHLSRTLAELGFATHLFFVGDPTRPGEEVRQGGKLILHRWGQWISEYYLRGVYDGENEKLYDFNDSIPWFVKDHLIQPALAQRKQVVVLGEEWHTAEAMCRLSDALYDDGVRDQVVMFWNANNTYSFHRINWPRLRLTTTITTVSRYMKHLMWQMGLNPLVIPNGISRQLLGRIDEAATDALRRSLGAEVVLFKMARWDPDKNWEGAIKAARGLKERGLKTVLVARGGLEPYGQEVVRYAHTLGLVGHHFPPALQQNIAEAEPEQTSEDGNGTLTRPTPGRKGKIGSRRSMSHMSTQAPLEFWEEEKSVDETIAGQRQGGTSHDTRSSVRHAGRRE
jgi:hypothetical protein